MTQQLGTTHTAPGDDLLDRLKSAPVPVEAVAGRGRRAVGGLLDLILIGLAQYGVAAFAAAGAPPTGNPSDVGLGAFVITSGLAALYMSVCWVAWGATLGMRVVRIHVANAQTRGPVSGRQALTRFLLWYVIGGLAFLVMLVSSDPLRQAWYDRAAGTVVLEG